MKTLNNYLFKLTSKIEEIDAACFSANKIANAMNLNRSTVSSYLNEGVRQGELIKVKTYPVLFLHRKSLEDQGYVLSKSEYDSLYFLKKDAPESVFQKVIGATGSLKESIDQIKTAVLYPNQGLPLLLVGASGSGKTFLASKIYAYALEEHVLQPKSPYIAYNCAQYFNNPELLSAALFGYTKGAFTGANEHHSGLLEKADGGILFLDEVHRLSEEGQEKLFTFMDTGEYSPMGDNSVRRKANVRLIFATTENIYTTFLPTFLRRLPVIVTLPTFQQRPLSERLALIDEFFLNESKILDRNLTVSDQLIDFLMNSDFDGNVGNIKNIIKYACGNAYVHQKQKPTVQIKLLDMPIEYSSKFKENFTKPRKNSSDRHYSPTDQNKNLLSTNSNDLLIQFFDEMFLEFTEVINDNKNFKEYMNRLSKKVTRIMDAFIFQESYDEEHSIYSVLVYHIRQTIDFLHDSYGFEQDGNRVITLANYLYIKGNYAYFDDRKENVALKETFREFLKNIAETPYLYAKKILYHLSQNLDLTVEEEDIYFMTIFFYSLNSATVQTGVKSVVLAHGYSTASSLANVANRILGKNVFQAYDMPIDISLRKIEAQIIRYISENRTDHGLILLVDMGSLNQLGESLKKQLKGPLLIIDHVNTPLLLEVGQAVLSGNSLTEINEKIQAQFTIQKQLVLPVVKKKKAIITCCYTGIGSARQIQEILIRCLGEKAEELEIIPYDYKKLFENKNYEIPFQLYDVLMIVGTENPQIPHVPYIGLDCLINGEAIGTFINCLYGNFEIEEETLKEDLIFNFSLSKIVENLTILDADKVLTSVQSAISEIEKLRTQKFSNNQLFLLYLHCCCMIERILRKESVDEQEDLAAYKKEHKKQMELIHLAFSDIEKEYTIQVPDLEVRLLNDIIEG